MKDLIQEPGKNNILEEVSSFVESMDLQDWTAVELTKEAEKVWKSEENYQAQENMGRDILSDYGQRSSIILVDKKRRPVLLMSKSSHGWNGLTVDPRLREEAKRILAMSIDNQKSRSDPAIGVTQSEN